jgi:putative flippase GtrA
MTLVRYIAIQLIAYGIDMGLFLAFIYLGYLDPLVSNILGKVAAGIFAFLVHRSFTFRLDKKEHSKKQKYRYFLLLGSNVPLSSLVLGLFLQAINYPVVAKLLSDVVIVVISFCVSKKWVFVADTDAETSSS